MSHIQIESVWDDVPTATNQDAQSESSPQEGAKDTYESLVGRVELMNLKKIELGINLDEPVHISAAEYRPHPRQGEIDPETRPYQHQFEWYEDYYSNVGEEIVKMPEIDPKPEVETVYRTWKLNSDGTRTLMDEHEVIGA